MKKRVFIFVSVVLLALAIVPLINFKFGGEQKKVAETKWWNRSALYNFDLALPYLSHFFYFFGISIDPNQVIIGKNNWIFLGDQYEKTITLGRQGATAQDIVAGKKIGLATNSWQKWLAMKGVRSYYIMIGPNKSSIYPEFLPDWAQPNTDPISNVLLPNVIPGLYFDMRSALKTAKTQIVPPLYYKTDTHWNNMGAWIAFSAFTKAIALKEQDLLWLSDEQVNVTAVNKRKGGDLAGFLRMTDMLEDSDVSLKIDSKNPVEIEQYDFDNNQLIKSGGNPQLGAPLTPLLVKSKNALNDKKVLWLRDSFGTAISPFMAATFSQTLQVHYRKTDPLLFAKLVEAFKPDHVFITVVERTALNAWFTTLPPPSNSPTAIILNKEKPTNFTLLGKGIESGVNDITKTEVGSYKVAGPDPFVKFNLSNPVKSDDASKLVFELKCDTPNNINLQVFWSVVGSGFSESDSIKFEASQPNTRLNLSSVPSWKQAGLINKIRIDVMPTKQEPCVSFTINNVGLGN